MSLILIAFIVTFMDYVGSMETFRYEKMNHYGLGRRVIPNFPHMNKDAYPDPLTTSKPKYIKSPYRSVYQGVLRKGDRRVYSRMFNLDAQPVGQQIVVDGAFDCSITHISAETTANVPIIYRGGAGYRYFVVIVRAKPGVELSGRVRAFCKKIPGET